MSQRTVAGERVRELLAALPHAPSRSIARMACEKWPTTFKDIEQARGVVRTYRGQHGAKNRSQVGKDFYRPAGRVTDGLIPLPPPLEPDKPWRIVPLEFRKALIISDIHVPYHDVSACRLALEHGRKLGVDCVVVLGDLMDFHSVSFWDRDPEHRDLHAELEVGRRFLEVLRDTFPRAKIVFKEGNHEERLVRWIWGRVPEFAQMPELSLAEVLNLRDFGIELVDNKQPIRCGEHLHLLHGHEFRAPFQNPVNPARGLFLRSKCNALCGDLHQSSTHTESGLDKVVSCWSIGCLCSLRPDYMPLNKWNLGFATVTLDGSAWSVANHKIIGGRVV